LSLLQDIQFGEDSTEAEVEAGLLRGSGVEHASELDISRSFAYE